MPTKYLLKPGQYHDSVALMETARELTQLPGVSDSENVRTTEALNGLRPLKEVHY